MNRYIRYRWEGQKGHVRVFRLTPTTSTEPAGGCKRSERGRKRVRTGDIGNIRV